jgi:hypothetical protein
MATIVLPFRLHGAREGNAFRGGLALVTLSDVCEGLAVSIFREWNGLGDVLASLASRFPQLVRITVRILYRNICTYVLLSI